MNNNEFRMTKRWGPVLLAGVVALVLAGVAGCASQLMPTPNLYTTGGVNPFADVPAELRTNHAEVIYVTDRKLIDSGDHGLHYGYGRSRSMAFGTVHVRFGRNVSWDELVAASRSQLRLLNLALSVEDAKELGRFPASPPYWERQADGEFVEPEDQAAQQKAAEESFKAMIARRLALGPCKDVYLFVHGFNDTFEDSVEVISQVWHFIGRRGVPVAFSWPAGRGGLRGYAYDRESGEFSVVHLKRLLRLLGECPGVERVHLLAHSRGTDVAITALRELHLECTAAKERTSEVLKLGTLVLASPDIDVDLALEKLSDERLFRVPEATMIYVSSGDGALKLANWLFLGMARLGRLRPTDLPPVKSTILQGRRVQFVDTFYVSTGFLGHSDFYWSPAASSDLMLVLRGRREPGKEHGRPLAPEGEGFWRIEPGYPRVDR